MYVWGKWSEVILIVLYVIKIVYIKFSVLNDIWENFKCDS